MSMTLVITGFPCSKKSWLPLVDSFPTMIITLADLLELGQSTNLKKLAKQVEQTILDASPTRIVAHDLGVTILLIALLRLHKKKKDFLGEVILFNGAFSRFNVFKARHPLRIQPYSFERLREEMLEVEGVEVDDRYQSLLPLVKILYLKIALFSVIRSLRQIVTKHKQTKLPLENRFKILLGIGDPYIPEESLRELQEILKDVVCYQVFQGHFPYSSAEKIEAIQPHLSGSSNG